MPKRTKAAAVVGEIHEPLSTPCRHSFLPPSVTLSPQRQKVRLDFSDTTPSTSGNLLPAARTGVIITDDANGSTIPTTPIHPRRRQVRKLVLPETTPTVQPSATAGLESSDEEIGESEDESGPDDQYLTDSDCSNCDYSDFGSNDDDGEHDDLSQHISDEVLLDPDRVDASDTCGLPFVIPNDKCEKNFYESASGTHNWTSDFPDHEFTAFRRCANTEPFGINFLSQFPGDKRKLPLSYWKLFFTDKIVDKIVKYTNIEAINKIGDKWKATDKVEMEAFFGLWYLFGITGLCGISATDIFSTVPGIGSMKAAGVMSRCRFQNLMRFLRFDERSTRDNKVATAPIKEIFDDFLVQCKLMFIPGSNITIDEAMVDFRGRCKFVMYLPSKPCKYGIKIWCLVDSRNFYMFDAKIYCGKETPDSPAERNLGENVVMSLTEQLRNAGRVLTTDNYFTSVTLAERLYKEGTYLVGTIRPNRVGLPTDFMKEKLDEHENRFCFCEELTLLRYQSKKDRTVALLSSYHHEPEVHDAGTGKATIVLAYNRNKGGVDTFDQMVNKYKCRQICRRWPVRIFGWMLDVAGLNASRLYFLRNRDSITTEKLEFEFRRKFIVKLADELCKPLEDIRLQGDFWYTKIVRQVSNVQIDAHNKFTRRRKRSTDASGLPATVNVPVLSAAARLQIRERCDPCYEAGKKDVKCSIVCTVCKKVRICSKHVVKYVGPCCNDKLAVVVDMEQVE